MNDLNIINATPDNIHQFGVCGYKNLKHEGYQQKLEWSKNRFAEGMRYKMLVSEKKGAIGGIEYIPGEFAWRPVNATGYMFIHCIYIMKKEAKGMGYGQKMLEACIEDAKESAMKGVAVIARKGSWMATPDIFLKMGFKTVDTYKPDFELMVLKFDAAHPDPTFISGWDEKLKQFKEGLYIFTSGQCPYASKATQEISEAAKEDFNILPNVIHLKTGKEAREVPFAFGTFGIILNGKVVADHPVSQTRFKNILKNELGL